MSDPAKIEPLAIENPVTSAGGSLAGQVSMRPVLERLYAEPQRFELFQAVRLLFAEAIAESAAVNGARQRAGRGLRSVASRPARAVSFARQRSAAQLGPFLA